MNVSFYLTPKNEVAYVQADHTTAQALKCMKRSGFQTIPVINEDGSYVGTISEGDFLWTLIGDYHRDIEAMDHKLVGSYKAKKDYKAVSIDAKIEELRAIIVEQNFVPVVDGRNVFIGIVTRKAVISELIRQKEEREQKINE